MLDAGLASAEQIADLAARWARWIPAILRAVDAFADEGAICSVFCSTCRHTSAPRCWMPFKMAVAPTLGGALTTGRLCACWMPCIGGDRGAKGTVGKGQF